MRWVELGEVREVKRASVESFAKPDKNALTEDFSDLQPVAVVIGCGK